MRRNSSKPAHLLLIALSLAFMGSRSGSLANTSATGRPPAAIPSRSRPQIRRLHHLPHRHRQRHHAQHRHRAPGMHRLSRRQSRNPPDRGRPERFSAIRSGQSVRPIPNPEPGQCPQLRQSDASLHRVAQRRLELHSLRQPRRPARRRQNLRHQRLPHRGSPKSPNQHDDPRCHAVGRRALQQRRVPVEDPTLW